LRDLAVLQRQKKEPRWEIPSPTFLNPTIRNEDAIEAAELMDEKEKRKPGRSEKMGAKSRLKRMQKTMHGTSAFLCHSLSS
jgi:hypothetical protein